MSDLTRLTPSDYGLRVWLKWVPDLFSLTSPDPEIPILFFSFSPPTPQRVPGHCVSQPIFSSRYFFCYFGCFSFNLNKIMIFCSAIHKLLLCQITRFLVVVLIGNVTSCTILFSVLF